MRYITKLTVVTQLLLCSLTGVAYAEGEIIEIEGARIRGNQELPTVLYLVPWQAPKVYELAEPETTLATQRAIKPLQRESFKRLLSYHHLFKDVINKR